jgi:hypothetical protein
MYILYRLEKLYRLCFWLFWLCINGKLGACKELGDWYKKEFRMWLEKKETEKCGSPTA